MRRESGEQSGAEISKVHPTWDRMLGTVYTKKTVDPEFTTHPGVMHMTTSDGLEIYPTKQFVIDESGKRQLIPIVAESWALLRSIDEQRGDSTATTMLHLVSPQTDGSPALFDQLVDPALTREEKYAILSGRIASSLHGAAVEGSPIQDPRLMLPRE